MRLTLGAVLLGLLSFQWGCQTSSIAAIRRDVNFAYVEGRAADLAKSRHDAKAGQIPDYLAQLDYDAYRDIRFDSQQALWASANLPFRIEFFHPGHIFSRTVKINEFTSTHEQEIPFNSGFYNYGRNSDLARRLPSSLGYAGFRVRYPINRVDTHDEVAVFLGASYFRVVGRDQVFGLSARALAIDTGLPSPEEFPRFREFWLGKPDQNATELTIYALLESERVAGAYKFVIRPGKDTEVDVTGTLFFRNSVERVGLAPFSSMFLFNELSMGKPADYRPQVHDSEGILVKPLDGNYIWRPLVNPPSNRTSFFTAEALDGFGLMQRDRDFAQYQDIEAAYHLRPSAWVTPKELPAGNVTLFEYQTKTEAEDNVALFYMLEDPVEPGTPVRFAYTLSFTSSERSQGGLVVSSRSGEALGKENVYEFVVDFAGEQLAELPEVEPVKPFVELNGGAELLETTIIKNRFNNSWRLVIYLRPAGPEPVELNARLTLNGETLTETWSHQWTR